MYGVLRREYSIHLEGLLAHQDLACGMRRVAAAGPDSSESTYSVVLRSVAVIVLVVAVRSVMHNSTAVAKAGATRPQTSMHPLLLKVRSTYVVGMDESCQLYQRTCLHRSSLDR